MKNFKKYILLSGVFVSLGISAQSVGIKNASETPATFPAPSASLDVYSTQKGITFPKYDLVEVTNPVSPVDFTDDINAGKNINGTMIFNDSSNPNGTFSDISRRRTPGYYIWVVDRWHLVIRKGEEPQQMSLSVPGKLTILPAKSYTPRAINSFKLVDTNIVGSSVNAAGDEITLPAGQYVYKYSVDLQQGEGDDNPNLIWNHNGGVRWNLLSTVSYLVDKNNSALPITDVIRENKLVAGRFANHSFSYNRGMFVFELKQPTTIKHMYHLVEGSTISKNMITRTELTAFIVRTGEPSL